MDLTIYGGNFDPASEATILVDGVEIFYTEFIGPEELQVGLYIAENAPDGSWPVAVFSPEGGETVLEGGFTIICPSGGEPPPEEPTEGPPEPPPGPPDDGDGPNWLLLIFIIGVIFLALVVGVGGGVILSRQRAVRMRKREQWQEKAQEGDPPEPCQPPSWYCKKEPEVELKRSKLTGLTLLARAPGTGRDHREMEVSGRLARDLDRAVVAHRLGKRLEELRTQIDTLAAALAREIVAWVQGEPSSQEVAIDATFEGAEFAVTFTLYRCVQKGPLTGWEEMDGWQVSYQHEHDAPVGTLFLQNPAEVGLAERITPDVSRLLMQFVQRS
jgi:hypothetical protein